MLFYFEVSKNGLIQSCRYCLGSHTEYIVSDKALLNTFRIKPETTENKITCTDDILLNNINKYVTDKITVNTQYIEEIDLEKIKAYDTILLFSPTGTGKTTAIKFINSSVKKNQRVLSVVSRRSMASLHIGSFPNMTCYLDNPEDTDNYIISLEQLYMVKGDYNILILDEVTSLLLHLYSPTMKKSRLKSFFKLVDIIRRCDKLIVCDAIITDAVLDFIVSLRSDKKIIYYRNTYKNKKDVKMNIYIRKHNPINKEIELFLKPVIKAIRDKKSIMIMSDSKSIINDIYHYLSKYTNDKKYFKIYTSDSGEFDPWRGTGRSFFGDDFKNCNKVWKYKCVLFSPKIVYGVDVTIEYDNIYAIYRGNSIDGFLMLQQISRARKVDEVNVLFLLKCYEETKNKYVTYEQNKYIEELDLENFLQGTYQKHGQENIDKLKENILYELGSITMSGRRETTIHEINENSLFGRIHLYVSWYKRLFNYNKSQLFIQLCKEQGYTITKKTFAEDTSKTQFKNVKDLIVKEIIQQTEKIITKHDTKTTDIIPIDNRKEMIISRLKSIKNMLHVDYNDLIKDKELRNIVIDEARFNNCMKSIILYYTKEELDKIETKEFVNNFSFIEKSKRLFKLLTVIEWLENKLKITRFQLIKLNVDNLKSLVKKMLKQIDIIQWLSYKTSETNRKTEITSRIEKVTSIDRLKKFFMDVINQFDEFYFYESTPMGHDKIVVYVNFSLNKQLIKDHAKIINCLRVDAKKFNEPIKQHINQTNYIKDIDY